jgi:hypothetical protein
VKVLSFVAELALSGHEKNPYMSASESQLAEFRSFIGSQTASRVDDTRVEVGFNETIAKLVLKNLVSFESKRYGGGLRCITFGMQLARAIKPMIVLRMRRILDDVQFYLVRSGMNYL